MAGGIDLTWIYYYHQLWIPNWITKVVVTVSTEHQLNHNLLLLHEWIAWSQQIIMTMNFSSNLLRWNIYNQLGKLNMNSAEFFGSNSSNLQSTSTFKISASNNEVVSRWQKILKHKQYFGTRPPEKNCPLLRRKYGFPVVFARAGLRISRAIFLRLIKILFVVFHFENG